MLTYVNPKMHTNFAHVIANHGRIELAKELSEANAVWIMQDGSVDLSQVDNYFHMIRYVTKQGDLKTAFLFLEEKILFGADGQWDCLQRSLVSLSQKWLRHAIESYRYAETETCQPGRWG